MQTDPLSARLTPTVHPQRMLLQQGIPLATPLVVYVEPSGYCNLKCSFCPHGAGEKAALQKDVMPLSLFRKLIDDLGMFDEKIKLLRVCGNGDPLVNKEIVSMVQYARAHAAVERIELVTNGLLLTDNLIQALPQVVDRIIISVEGLCSEDYRRTCGVDIDFHKLLVDLDRLYKGRGRCVLHVKTFDEAVASADSKEAFWKIFSCRCDEIYIEKLVPMWPGLDIGRSTDEFRWGGALVEHRVCAQIFKGVQVQANGVVVPCCVDWRRINVVGDVNEQSLQEIWRGEKLRALQIRHLSGDKGSTEPCKDCRMNDHCEVDNIDLHAEECLQRLRARGH